MLRVAALLLCAICFGGALPCSEATALLPATKRRLALQQQGQTAEPVVVPSPTHKDAVEVLTEQLDEEADQMRSPAVRRSEQLVEKIRSLVVNRPDVVVAAGPAKSADLPVSSAGPAKLLDLAISAVSPVNVGQKNIQGLKKGLKKSPYAQEVDDLAVINRRQNSIIFAEILQLETQNQELRKRTQDLQSSNHMLRSEMDAMGWKLFNTVSVTDDGKDPSLNVPQVPKLTLKHKQGVEADQEFTKAELADFEARHDKWQASFKAWFTSHNEAAGTPKALMALQKALAGKRSKSEALMQGFQKFLAKLTATHLELTSRIHGIAQLMKDLDHLGDTQEVQKPQKLLSR